MLTRDQWNVTTPDELVSLLLCKGPGSNIARIGTIADSIQDTGEYLWAIPANLVSGTDYAIEIIVGPASNASNVGPDGYNFTPQLTLVNNSTAPLGSNSTITASSSSALASSTTSVTTPSSTGAAATGGTPVATEEPTPAETTSGPTNTATATHASGATRFDAMMGGHGFFALIVALAVGIVASY